MTGCPVTWKCSRAWRAAELSQQPTAPQVRHIRRCTQRVLSLPQAGQAGAAAGPLHGVLACAQCRCAKDRWKTMRRTSSATRVVIFRGASLCGGRSFIARSILQLILAEGSARPLRSRSGAHIAPAAARRPCPRRVARGRGRARAKRQMSPASGRVIERKRPAEPERPAPRWVIELQKCRDFTYCGPHKSVLQCPAAAFGGSFSGNHPLVPPSIAPSPRRCMGLSVGAGRIRTRGSGPG